MSQTDGNETPVHLDDDTEFVVEYRSTSRTRLALVAIIVILVLLLGVLGWVIVSTMRPIGAPAQADLPEGLSWVRSIYAWGPTPAERLRSPIDVAVAPDGLVWASTNTSLLVGFTPDGELERVIDRLAILGLKIFHLSTLQARKRAVNIDQECAEKVALLEKQREDLAGCFVRLIEDARAGRRYFTVYRQFKAYNDPRLNPVLSERS